MTFENARFADAEGATVLVEINGRPSAVPVDLGNSDYRDLLASGVPIAPAAT